MSIDNVALLDAIVGHFNLVSNSRGNYNFRCPYCGDSKKSSRKMRGWIYRKNNVYSYFCHNCFESKSLYTFIQDFMPNTDVREFFLDSAIENYNKPKRVDLDFNIEQLWEDAEFNDVIKTSFNSISQLPDTHYIKNYLLGRKVMPHKLDDIFFIDDLSKLNEVLVDEFDYFKTYSTFFYNLKINYPNSVAILYPFRGENGTYDAFQLQISNYNQKYVIFNVTDDYDKHMYGMHDVDDKQPLFICEGTIDSLMFDNCISSISSGSLRGVATQLLHMGYRMDDMYLVYDKDFLTNPEVNKQFIKALEDGFNLYFYDDFDIYSNNNINDLNDMVVKGGISGQDVRNSIYKNSKCGYSAILYTELMGAVL